MTREDEKVIKDALEATKLPYEFVEAKGKLKVLMCGQLVGMVPACRGRSDKEALYNVRAQIRRFAKQRAEHAV